MIRTVTLLLLLTITGCWSAFNPGLKKDLVKRASYDMNCPENQLNVTELSSSFGMSMSYGVRGCGQQSTYVLQEGGVWSRNTNEPAAPSAPTTPATPPAASTAR